MARRAAALGAAAPADPRLRAWHPGTRFSPRLRSQVANTGAASQSSARPPLRGRRDRPFQGDQQPSVAAMVFISRAAAPMLPGAGWRPGRCAGPAARWMFANAAMETRSPAYAPGVLSVASPPHSLSRRPAMRKPAVKVRSMPPVPPATGCWAHAQADSITSSKRTADYASEVDEARKSKSCANCAGTPMVLLGEEALAGQAGGGARCS